MVEVRVLGAFRVTASKQRDVEALTHQAKRAALLAYLAAAAPHGQHRRDKVLALFWPELDESRARAALNQAVYVLRTTLGDNAIVPHGNGTLGLSNVVWCDAVAFEAELEQGRLAEALELYRGDFLDGFFIAGAPEFERWVEGERERLRQRACVAASALAESNAAEGDTVGAARWARRAADLLPADEAVTRRLMTFLHRLGDRAAAIRVYDAFVARLSDDYELEPSAETRVLAESIRAKEQAMPLHWPAAVLRPMAVISVPLRRRRLGWLAAMSAILISIAAGAWMWLRDREPPRRPVVRFTLDFPAGQRMAELAGSTIAVSPDGSRLVYVGNSPSGTQLFLRALANVEAVPIPYTRGAHLPFFSPDGAWLGFVMGNTIRKVRLAGGPAITVCQLAANVPGASWGSNDLIVFSTPAGLSVVSAKGGQPRLLAASDTARGERYRWPDVLPSGRAAVFTRVNADGFHLAAVSLQTGQVVPLRLAGANPRFIAPGYLLFARPDGALLAAAFDQHTLRVTGPEIPIAEGVFVGIAGVAKLGVSREGVLAYVPNGAGDRILVMVDRTGRAEPVPAPPRGFHSVRFSPDGNRIASQILPPDGDRPDIWVLDLNGSTQRRVTFDSGSSIPVWSVDGRRIAFASKPGGRQYGYTVRWMSAEAGDSAETLVTPSLGAFPGEFTRDGRALVFQTRHPVTAWDLWIVSLEGKKIPRPYLAGPSDEHSPAMSPDGRWLSYVSNESGRNEVYVRSFLGQGSPVQISSAGGREPRWASNGTELFYRSQGRMMAATMRMSRSVSIVRRTSLFDDEPYFSRTTGAAYDVHPDGQRFLMIRRGAESPQVVVVLNGFDAR